MIVGYRSACPIRHLLLLLLPWPARPAWDLPSADDPVCLGLVHGLVGKLDALPGSEPALLLVESCSLVGRVWDDQPVYRVEKIGILSLGPQDAELEARRCPKHDRSVAFGGPADEDRVQSPRHQQHKVALTKTWGSIKSATKSLKSTTLQRIGKDGAARDGDRAERVERRLWDEIYKMFDRSESFYFSPGADLTNSARQRWAADPQAEPWRRANSRFFWNRFLLKDLIEMEVPFTLQSLCGTHTHTHTHH